MDKRVWLNQPKDTPVEARPDTRSEGVTGAQLARSLRPVDPLTRRMEERNNPPPFDKRPPPRPTQVSVNPSVPGKQPKNTPSGRDAPQQSETRGW